MISRSLILQILQAAKIMRRFFYEAPAEIMRIYTTDHSGFQPKEIFISPLYLMLNQEMVFFIRWTLSTLFLPVS